MSTNYRTPAAVSITLANGSTGLASSSTLTIGQCSAALTNAVNKDDFARAVLQVRADSTAPTTGGSIELWAFAQRADGVWPDLFTTAYTGADGPFTARSRDILAAGAKRLGVVTNDAVASQVYTIDGLELSQMYGFLQRDFAFFVTQSTGRQLHPTASNHSLQLHLATAS